MHRRTVLAGVACMVTGCMGSGSESDETISTQSTRTPPETTGSATTATTTESTTTETAADATTTQQPYDLVPTNPASMTESEVQDVLAERECSEFTDRPEVCVGEDARLDVSVTPTVGTLPQTTIEYTVENQADERFRTGHYDWSLYKWDGRQWRGLAPLAILPKLDAIRTGESHTHRLTVVERKVVRSPHAYLGKSDITLGGLGPGVYGFSTQGYFESTPDQQRELGAVFGLAGEAPPMYPTDDVTQVERDGSTLVVHTDAPSSKHGAKWFTVSFVDGAADVRVLPEHVKQVVPLLNTLSYAATDGIERIRYEGGLSEVNFANRYLALVTPTQGDSRYAEYKSTRFGFRDYVFEVTIGET